MSPNSRLTRANENRGGRVTFDGTVSPVSEAEAVDFLRKPESYPQGTEAVSVVETHFSYVFLTDREVYKLKKPQRYPFVDLSSPAARRANCMEEVRLNRRLAPDVYLGVVTLARGSDGVLALDGAGQAVDYLVHMRRLDDALNLERQLLHGNPEPVELDGAAARLTSFYADNAPTGTVEPSVRRSRYREQADELRQLLGNGRSDALRDALLAWLDSNQHALANRSVREVHGDLRPEHIYLGRHPCMIDRLEFEPALRQLDPLEELAFLTLECDRLGQRRAGERFVEYYLAASGDQSAPGLGAFYEAARALLWALLGARHLLTQPERSEHWRQRTHWYLEAGMRALARGD